MADTKISGLTALTGASVDTSADVIPIVDTSVTTTKKITVAELAIALGATGASQAELDAGTVTTKFIPPSLRKVSLLATQASTSGTSIDFTVPSGVREITVMFVGVSGNGTSNYLLQLGDAGGVETAGYVSGASRGSNSGSSTAGFLLSTLNAATSTLSGSVRLNLVATATFQWVSSGVLTDTTTPESYVSGGNKATSQEVSTVRVTFVNGSDAFDAGLIGCSYIL